MRLYIIQVILSATILALTSCSCTIGSGSSANPSPSSCFAFGIDQQRSGYIDYVGPSSVDLDKPKIAYVKSRPFSEELTASSISQAVDGTLYFQSSKGGIKAYSIGGKLKWALKDSGGYSTPTILPTGNLAAGSETGLFYLLKPNGVAIWEQILDSAIYSSPVYVDDKIFVASTAGTLYCIDLTGKVIWKQNIGSSIHVSLTLCNDYIVCATNDGNIHVFNVNGAGVAHFSLDNKCSDAAAAYGKRFYISDWSGNVYCLSVDGKMLWKTNLNNENLTSPSVSRSNRIYVGGIDALYVLDLDGNQIQYIPLKGRVNGKPIIDAEDKVYVSIISYTQPSEVQCINRDGRVMWSFKLTNHIPNPVIVDKNNHVIFSTGGNAIVILEEVIK